jgi:hypothetical protein
MFAPGLRRLPGAALLAVAPGATIRMSPTVEVTGMVNGWKV